MARGDPPQRSKERALFRAPYGLSQGRFSPIGGGLFLDAITEEPLRIDRIEAQPMLQFLAQFADMALDDVLIDVLVEEPVDGVEDLRLADAAAATAQQKLEDPPLAARERKRLAVHFGLAPVKVDAQFADRDVAVFAEHAPVDRSDPSHDLAHMHRLAQDVVRAGGEEAKRVV